MSKNLQRTVAAILFAGFIIRIWRLGDMPPAIHPDEMAGLVGVLDELSGRAPLRPFFDYRIFYLPLTGIGEYFSSLLFGYNAWAYRFPSVLYGLVTIGCTMGLMYRLTRDRLAAVCAGAVSAVLPWEINVSRLAWENATMLPYLMGGLWALRAGIEDRKVALLALAGILIGVDAYSYRAALPDGLALSAAVVALDLRASQRAWRGIALSSLLVLLCAGPLVASVIVYPRFFWRDAYIATFAHGVDARSLGQFAQNYLAHFDPQALFFRGDGVPEHGPAFGVLYLWMLPMLVLGFLASFRRYGTPIGLFFLAWLAIYPVGGAVTNDGVPHFLRTLIGAPLAAMLCGAGLAVAWRLIKPFAWRLPATAALLALALASLVQYTHAYFVDYVVPAADAFQYENRDLFTTIRAHGTAARICFHGLDDMNARTLFSYYLRDRHVEIHERLDAACFEPDSLIATNDVIAVPPDATPVATIQDYEGNVKYRLYLTAPKRR